MGNSASGSAGAISISLNTAESLEGFIAGTNLAGTIYATVSKPIPAKTTLIAFVIGKEKCKVKYHELETHNSGGHSTTRIVTRYAYGSREIMRIPVPLVLPGADSVSGEINPGRFEYPFQVLLPSDLPSTMRYDGNGGFCQVSYKIKVELKAWGWSGLHYKEKQLINVRSAPIEAVPVPFIASPDTQAVKFCCCFSRGVITCGAKVDDTLVGAGEEIKVSVGFKNESTSIIKFVEAYVVEKLEWWAGGHHDYVQNYIDQKKLGRSGEMEAKSKHEVTAVQKSIRLASFGPNISAQNQRKEILKQLFRSIENGDNVVSLRIPTSAHHTYRGQCIKCSHNLVVKVHTGNCVNNISLEIPLVVGTRSVVSPSNPATPVRTAPPTGWDTATAAITAPVVILANGKIFPDSPVKHGDGAKPKKNQANQSYVDMDTYLNNIQQHQPVSASYADEPPTIASLLREIDVSVNSVTTVTKLLKDDKWKRNVFEPLEPKDFAAIIRKVRIDFEQPEIAVAIAPSIRKGGFICSYVVAAVGCVSSWLRVPMVKKLLPFCVDLKENQGQIKAVLDEWEKVCTDHDFDEYLSEK